MKGLGRDKEEKCMTKKNVSRNGQRTVKSEERKKRISNRAGRGRVGI